MTTFGGGSWSKAVHVMVKSNKEHMGTKSYEIKIKLSLLYISKQAKPGKSTTVTKDEISYNRGGYRGGG